MFIFCFSCVLGVFFQVRFRQRYLDLMLHPEKRQIFEVILAPYQACTTVHIHFLDHLSKSHFSFLFLLASSIFQYVFPRFRPLVFECLYARNLWNS